MTFGTGRDRMEGEQAGVFRAHIQGYKNGRVFAWSTGAPGNGACGILLQSGTKLGRRGAIGVPPPHQTF